MPTTIQRTHRLGRPLNSRDRDTPIQGEVTLASLDRTDLKRCAQFLAIDLHLPDGHRRFPDLWDPRWLTFGSGRGCMVVGFEEINGQRYYQGWHILWE